MATDVILSVEGLCKSFAGIPVLREVSLDIKRNSVVGIVGENGAGKSTLFNVISGVVAPDRGRIRFRGREIRPLNYRQANLLGISRVFQDQALLPNVPVYANLFLSHEDYFVRFGQVLDKRRMIEIAERLVDAFGLEIDVRERTGNYDFSVRQSIEIARACLVPREVLGIDTPVVLLDEPTAALSKSAEEALFRLIRKMKLLGSVVFVSHRLGEVLSISDVIYVLRDGRVVAGVDPAQTDELMLHRLMVGRERDADYYHEDGQVDATNGSEVFAINDFSAAGAYRDVNLKLREGEILGIGGLLDSGKSQLGRAMAGLQPPDHGVVRFCGSEIRRPTFRNLMAKGLAYVPAERLAEGLIASFPIAWNVSLAGGQDMFSTRWGYWRRGAEEQVSQRYMQELNIRAQGGPYTRCTALSGGNQQKVVLAKWLCRAPRVMILDNPTRGIDAGAKEEVYRLIRGLTADGVAIVLITDELLELIGMSSRIAIMRAGRISAVIDAPPGGKPTESQLVALMVGN